MFFFFWWLSDMTNIKEDHSSFMILIRFFFFITLPQGTQNPKDTWQKRFLNARHIFVSLCLGLLFGSRVWTVFLSPFYTSYICMAWNLNKKVSDIYFSWFCNFSSKSAIKKPALNAYCIANTTYLFKINKFLEVNSY